jgi:hypothetical protein
MAGTSGDWTSADLTQLASELVSGAFNLLTDLDVEAVRSDVNAAVSMTPRSSDLAQVYATLALAQSVRELTAEVRSHQELLRAQLGQLNMSVNRIAQKL